MSKLVDLEFLSDQKAKNKLNTENIMPKMTCYKCLQQSNQIKAMNELINELNEEIEKVIHENELLRLRLKIKFSL